MRCCGAPLAGFSWPTAAGGVVRGPTGPVLLWLGLDVALSRPARRVPVRNTVGAGDSLLAWVVDAVVRKSRSARWLAVGLDTAAKAVGRPGGLVPRA